MASRRLVTSPPKVPRPPHGRRVRTATSPDPPGSSWWAVKGRQTPVSRVYLLVSLTGPAPSGSTGTLRRCQGCSHPHRRLPDQAALNFTPPLRRQGGEGLSPPLDSKRLVAHMGLCPIITDEQHRDRFLLVNQPGPESTTVRRSYARANGSVLERHDIPPVVSPPHQPGAARSRRRPRRTALISARPLAVWIRPLYQNRPVRDPLAPLARRRRRWASGCARCAKMPASPGAPWLPPRVSTSRASARSSTGCSYRPSMTSAIGAWPAGPTIKRLT